MVFVNNVSFVSLGFGIIFILFSAIILIYVIKIVLEVGFGLRGIPRVALLGLFYAIILLASGLILIIYGEKYFLLSLILILIAFIMIIDVFREIYRGLKTLIYG